MACWVEMEIAIMLSRRLPYHVDIVTAETVEALGQLNAVVVAAMKIALWTHFSVLVGRVIRLYR